MYKGFITPDDVVAKAIRKLQKDDNAFPVRQLIYDLADDGNLGAVLRRTIDGKMLGERILDEEYEIITKALTLPA